MSVCPTYDHHYGLVPQVGSNECLILYRDTSLTLYRDTAPLLAYRWVLILLGKTKILNILLEMSK